MSNQRIPLDLSGFTEPKPKDKPTKQQIDEVASESGFTTRHATRQAEEPQPERNRPVAPTKPAAHPADEAVQQEPMRRGRKRTTNRNTPFAVKLKLETNNAIYRLAEELECNAIAEVIERAIAALEREIADRR